MTLRVKTPTQPMKKVLVTGASGFIGRLCVQLLSAHGWEVHAVSSQPLPPPSPVLSNVFWHQADLLDNRQIHELFEQVKPECLLHLAWCSIAPGQVWISPLNFRWVQASLELLQAFTENGGRRLVLSGSCAEYDWATLKMGDACREYVTPLGKTTPYGTCKHALYLLQESWTRQMSLSAAWGRVFFVYGPDEHPNRLVSATIRALLQAALARCSTGEQIRDFLHVHDVASAFVSLLESDVQGVVNIGSGQGVAVKEIATRIGEILGKPELIELGALPTRADDPPYIVADVVRLQQEIGWKPYYDLQRGLESTIEWWREKESQSSSSLELRR